MHIWTIKVTKADPACPFHEDCPSHAQDWDWEARGIHPVTFGIFVFAGTETTKRKAKKAAVKAVKHLVKPRERKARSDTTSPEPYILKVR